MAAIDKIYCDSYKDLKEFYAWCIKFDGLCIKDTGHSLLDGFYCIPSEFKDLLTEEELEYAWIIHPFDGYFGRSIPMTNFTEVVDRWLMKHCPIGFVRRRLSDQYLTIKLKLKDIELYLDRG